MRARTNLLGRGRRVDRRRRLLLRHRRVAGPVAPRPRRSVAVASRSPRPTRPRPRGRPRPRRRRRRDPVAKPIVGAYRRPSQRHPARLTSTRTSRHSCQAMLSGTPLIRTSMQGSVFTSGSDMCLLICGDEPYRYAKELGVAIDDITIAFAVSDTLGLGMIAYRARGAKTDELIPARIAIGGFTGHGGLYDLPVTVAGRPVTYLDAGMGDSGEYLMTRHDVLFIVLGEAPSKGECRPGILRRLRHLGRGPFPPTSRRHSAGFPEQIRPCRKDGYHQPMTRDSHRPLREAWIVEAVRTPIGRYGGALASVRPDDLAAAVLRGRRRPRRHRPGPRRGRHPRLRQPGRRGQPRRRADGAAPGRLPGRGRRADRQPAVRLRAPGDQLGRARDRRRRRRRVHRRRRRIDDPRAVRPAQGRGGLRPRQPRAGRHDARLAVRQPAPGRAALPVLDGRDRRERRRALGRLRASARTRSRSRASGARSPPSRPAGSTTSSSRSRSRSGRASRSSSIATSTRAPTPRSRRWRA